MDEACFDSGFEKSNDLEDSESEPSKIGYKQYYLHNFQYKKPFNGKDRENSSTPFLLKNGLESEKGRLEARGGDVLPDERPDEIRMNSIEKTEYELEKMKQDLDAGKVSTSDSLLQYSEVLHRLTQEIIILEDIQAQEDKAFDFDEFIEENRELSMQVFSPQRVDLEAEEDTE